MDKNYQKLCMRLVFYAIKEKDYSFFETQLYNDIVVFFLPNKLKLFIKYKEYLKEKINFKVLSGA